MDRHDHHIGILTERMTLGYGVDLVIHEQAVRLIKLGYKVTVFPGWKTDLYDDQPYDVVPLAGETDCPVHFYSLDFMNQAFDIINQHKVTAWLIHTPPFYFWLTHLPGPVVMVEHGSPPGKYFRFREGRFLDSQTKKRHRKCFRSTRTGDGLIAISEYIRSELPKDVQRKTTVIHNGVDHYSSANRDDVHAFRKKHGVKATDILVVWVGRIQPVKDPQPYKGLQDFISIAKELMTENQKIKVLAAGKGDPDVVAYLKKAGIMTELNVPREMMPVVYAAGDIFLNTSIWEGFNLPIGEAQIQGTPVVALNLCAHPEVVADGYSGYLVDTMRDLKQKVLDLAADSKLRRLLSENARLQAEQFTWDTNVEQLDKLLVNCLELIEKGTEDPVARIQKSPGYYLDYGQYLVQRFGWKTLIVESIGWVKRRLFKTKH